MSATITGKWLLLCGGIGGAKLALGLDRLLPPGALTVLVNTGDDFTHLGLRISPDLDTVLYTLADVVNPETGWGWRDETWQFMEALDRLGGEVWFRLGDRDLATHVERTRRLAAGETPSAVAADFCARLGVASRLLPMSDTPVATRLRTATGWLDFQDYFVRLRAAPVVSALDYAGAGQAAPNPALFALLADPELAAIVIAPSNPWLSIAPILALPGLRDALRGAGVPVIAISPLIGGAAVKGPTAKLMTELGLEVNSAGIARFYWGLADVLVIDHADSADAPAVAALDIRPSVTATLMRTLEDRLALARAVCELAACRGRVAS
jgi:LPPG:FO 2-phospho-L-lactate transferase